jgi:hypothetical protein
MNTEPDLHSHATEKPEAAAPDTKKQGAAMPAAPEMAGRGISGEEQARMTHGSTAGGAMSGGDHEQQMYRDSLWASFVNLILGLWLIASPPTLGYKSTALTWSDIVSGSLIVVLSIAAASRRFNAYARWAVCFVGLWLLFAPLVFWAPTVAEYLNDTVVGAFVIAFAILVTMMPGMDMSAMDGADVPPGWSYNPSSWLQRAPVILLAVVGLLSSRYMAAYQLGHLNSVSDPFSATGRGACWNRISRRCSRSPTPDSAHCLTCSKC